MNGLREDPRVDALPPLQAGRLGKVGREPHDKRDRICTLGSPAFHIRFGKNGDVEPAYFSVSACPTAQALCRQGSQLLTRTKATFWKLSRNIAGEA